MEEKQTKIVGGLVLTVIVLAALLAGTIGLKNRAPDPLAGDIGDSRPIIDRDSVMPTVSQKTAGPQADTVIVATNTARIHLEISNISTSSVGQTLYCNTNDRPVTVGIGIPIFASSTKDLSYLSGAVRCKYATASSSVTFAEK